MVVISLLFKLLKQKYMIYQVVFSVCYPIHNDKRDKEELRREFMLIMEGDLFSKKDKFQTHDNCWFIDSELTANELYELINPNGNINILITRVNHNISGFTAVTFWKWIKEKMKSTEELSDCASFL